MDEDLAKEIFLTTESCPDPLINISYPAQAQMVSVLCLFGITIIIVASYVSNKNFEITRLTEELSKARNTRKLITLEEELSKARNTIKEREAHHREEVDQNISMMYEISTLKEMNERLKDMNERQAGRLKFFRGLGVTLPSDDLEVDDTPTDEG